MADHCCFSGCRAFLTCGHCVNAWCQCYLFSLSPWPAPDPSTRHACLRNKVVGKRMRGRAHDDDVPEILWKCLDCGKLRFTVVSEAEWYELGGEGWVDVT